MGKIDLVKLLETQISLSEWFENAKHKNSVALKVEDNEKRDRLLELEKVLGLPFDKPIQFPAIDLVNQPSAFVEFLTKSGENLCALRLIPLDLSLPKLRMRGMKVKDVLKTWLPTQKIDYTKYKADFIPHTENQLWSTIFIVNKNGVFGEITKGGHHQLTQGFYDQGEPIVFAFDFKKWQFSQNNPKAQKAIKEMVAKIKVTNPKKRQLLKDKLNSAFSFDYLNGYFEAILTKEFGLWFVDYNRILGKHYANFSLDIKKSTQINAEVRGLVASSGRAQGKAKVVNVDNLKDTKICENEILICKMTTPDFLPLMQKATAIVTDFGGILSHAAIIARELGKPCLTNTKTATQTFHNGDILEIDAEIGVIRKIN